MVGREKELVRHVSEEDLDRLLSEADDLKVYKRLVFLKLLYGGATLAEAADDIGVSEGTASDWVRRWNEGGLGKLTPNFGGGRPPKLDEAEQDQLVERLREGQPWKKQEIQHLLAEEFDVEYHPHYLPTFLDELGLSYAIPRPERPDRPDNAREILDERVGVRASLGGADPRNDHRSRIGFHRHTARRAAMSGSRLRELLQENDIEHAVCRVRRPQSNGKLKRFYQTYEKHWDRFGTLDEFLNLLQRGPTVHESRPGQSGDDTRGI